MHTLMYMDIFSQISFHISFSYIYHIINQSTNYLELLGTYYLETSQTRKCSNTYKEETEQTLNHLGYRNIGLSFQQTSTSHVK